MENEKYGVELIAETNGFKEKLKELSNLIKDFKKEIEDNINIPFKADMPNSKKMFNTVTDSQVFNETKRYTELTRMIDKAQSSVDNYNSKINKLEKDMESLANESQNAFEQLEQLRSLDFKAESGESFTPAEGLLYGQLAKDKTKLENAEQKYYDVTQTNERKMADLLQRRIIAEQQLEALKEKQRQEAQSGTSQEEIEKTTNELEILKQKYVDLKNNNNSLGKSLKSVFKDSIRSIKRFSLTLLGARTALGMFLKYQSIYYQYNEKMQYQSELSQNAIALSLAPAFEFLGNVIAYASIAFAKFIELLTGINVLSKVSTKGIRDYNKSLKETQTLLSGVDEITNLSMPSGTGLASQYDALKKFQDMTKKFDGWWEKFKKDFIDWLWDPELIEKIGNEGLIPVTWQLLEGMFKGLYDRVLKKHVDLIVTRMKEDLRPIWEPIVTEFGPALDLIKEKWNSFLGPKIFEPLKEKFNDMKNALLKQLAPILNRIIDIWNNTFGWLFGKIDYLKNDTEEKLEDLGKTVADVFKDQNVDVNYNVTANTSKAESAMSNLFKKFGLATLNAGQSLADSVLKLLNPHANGLDYVPYDNYPALLHKGEAVVPAKYNPTVHSTGNEYTNSLLETLIMKVDDLSRRPNEFVIDGERFANATYPLYEEQRARQNYVEGVVVR